jgi:hypothetical protein
MIDRCFNPACGIAMRYLRDGRVVRVTRDKGGESSIEHHWLCGLCYRTHDFEFLPDGAVNLKEKTSAERVDELHFGDVVLPERRSVKRARGEPGPSVAQGTFNARS